jgi:hypothetical protein
MNSPSKSQATGNVGAGTRAPASSVLPAETDLELVEDRHAMIAEVAFFIAESRGFVPGHELEDWLAAEREIEQASSPADR